MLACGPAVDIRVVAHKLWQSSGHVLEHGDDLLDAAMRADGLVIFEEPMTLGLLQVSWAPRSHARRTVQDLYNAPSMSFVHLRLLQRLQGTLVASVEAVGTELERC
jgi:hypothetical protein